jgi:hypothetical protein
MDIAPVRVTFDLGRGGDFGDRHAAFGAHTAPRSGAAAIMAALGAAAFTAGPAFAQTPTIAKNFGAASVPLGGSTSLTFTVTSGNAGTSSNDNVAFTDTLPPGLVVATPNGSPGSCGGVAIITATPASSTISFQSDLFLGSCTFSVNVTGTSPGVKNNSVTVTSLQGTGNTANASLTVTQGTTTTALISSVNPSAVGQSVTFTATVTGSGATPTGTVTFTIDGTPQSPVALSGAGKATFTTSTLAAGAHSIVASYGGDSNFTGSTSTVLTQNVQAATSTALTSSLNPSAFGQAVTFTATVTGATPTGTVTFKDGATVIGTGTLNGAGVATFTISSLAVGNHSITATYNGDTNNPPSTSAVLTQSVNVPADSVKLRALQLVVTKIEAQSSGAAISGAVDGAIADGFSDNGGAPITASDNGLRFNFAAEPQEKSKVEERVGDTFAALGYARDVVLKAPPPRIIPKEWLLWAEVRGTGWNTNLQTGDIRGGQTNALLGLTHKLSPDFLVGVFGGYENFDYTSQLLTGRLKGDGWTAGGYLGWRLLPGVRFDASVARSGSSYDGMAGTASGTFPGQRWFVSAALIGNYKTMQGFEIEPSAKVYALWEHDNTYTDSLGIVQTERNFSTGRASAGTKVAYPWLWSATATVAPYVGIYADYYFNRDDGTLPVAPLLLPTEFVHGWSARVTSGVAMEIAGGPKLSVGGEVGGLGSNQFTTWSVRGRAAVPF